MIIRKLGLSKRAFRAVFSRPARATALRFRSPKVAAAVGALGIAWMTTLDAQEGWRWSEASRVVAVGDIHGAYDELVGLLETVGVLDESARWSGGTTHLVSLGDVLDRGPDSRRALDLLMRLQTEAAADGGAVHVLLGNHELMNLLGDLRYVSDAEFAAFAAEEPADMRAAAFERFRRELPADVADAEAAEAFRERYPAGYFAHRIGFSPSGRYGAWLLSLPAVIVVNDTAFAHAGLPELVQERGLETLNATVTDSVRRYYDVRQRLVEEGHLPPFDMEDDLARAYEVRAAAERNDETLTDETIRAFATLAEIAESPALGPAGPLWYRGAVYCNPAIESNVLAAALRSLDAERVVVGHTVTEDRRVRIGYDGQLLLLDTGMLESYYRGRPAALILEGQEVVVQYLAPDERQPPSAELIDAYGLTETELLSVLASGDVMRADQDEANGDDSTWPVAVRDGTRTIEAAFYPEDGRNAAGHELAAYRLDRLLGFHLVPPTVARRVNGTAGALQLRYSNAITEAQRVERRLAPGTWCPIEPQWRQMGAFDLLIGQQTRHADDVFYRYDVSALGLTGHARAFGTRRRVSFDAETAALEPQLQEALRELDDTRLESSVGAWLSDREIRALLERRDSLLEQMAERARRSRP